MWKRVNKLPITGKKKGDLRCAWWLCPSVCLGVTPRVKCGAGVLDDLFVRDLGVLWHVYENMLRG